MISTTYDNKLFLEPCDPDKSDTDSQLKKDFNFPKAANVFDDSTYMDTQDFLRKDKPNEEDNWWDFIHSSDDNKSQSSQIFEAIQDEPSDSNLEDLTSTKYHYKQDNGNLNITKEEKREHIIPEQEPYQPMVLNNNIAFFNNTNYQTNQRNYQQNCFFNPLMPSYPINPYPMIDYNQYKMNLLYDLQKQAEKVRINKRNFLQKEKQKKKDVNYENLVKKKVEAKINKMKTQRSALINPDTEVRILCYVFLLNNQNDRYETIKQGTMTYHLLLQKHKKVDKVYFNAKTNYYECELKNRFTQCNNKEETRHNQDFLINCINATGSRENWYFCNFFQEYVDQILKGQSTPINKLSQAKQYQKKLTDKERAIINKHRCFVVKHKISYDNDEVVSFNVNKQYLEWVSINDIKKESFNMMFNKIHANMYKLFANKLSGNFYRDDKLLGVLDLVSLLESSGVSGLPQPNNYFDGGSVVYDNGKYEKFELVQWDEEYTKGMELYKVSYNVILKAGNGN